MRSMFLLLGTAAMVAAPTIASAQMAGRVLSPRYVQEAQQDHPKLDEEFGGAETGSRAAYVDGVGRRVAAYSGVTPRAYRFTLLNSAVENAFAVPGGYVYITRQLMGIINDEAELAFVVGHETGHIAGNHHQRHGTSDDRCRRRFGGDIPEIRHFKKRRLEGADDREDG